MKSQSLPLLIWLSQALLASTFSIHASPRQPARRLCSARLALESPSRLFATASKESEGGSSAERIERIQEEMGKAKTMKVAELKKELEERGISTKSFFEKSEFVRAYAEAIVDKVPKGSSNNKSGSSRTSSSSRKQASTAPDEPYDPSYRDVAVQKFNARDPRLLSGLVIDIALGR